MVAQPVKPSTSISTHAPAGGATRRVRHDGLRLGYFYSRPCGRGDAGQSWRNLYATRISTHAPAGGATKSRMLSLPSASNFYSRPCGRGDQLFWRLQIVLHRFLLTPLREGRLSSPSVRNKVFNFYSRPCGRGDWYCKG